MLRIVVADDSVPLREGLVRLLRDNGHDLVSAGGDGPSLVDAIEQHTPDVPVVDLRCRRHTPATACGPTSEPGAAATR